MNYRATLITGAAFAALAVMIGAFGAHLLKEVLVQTGRTETYELAVRYQFYHAFGLLITGIMQKIDESFNLKWVAIFFSAGILFFSGSLFVLSLTGIKMLGAITPIGGLFFIAGWLTMLIGIINSRKKGVI
jgi:uncharacterized membrane protein YgdD (TMEM256/DUF423 family)